MKIVMEEAPAFKDAIEAIVSLVEEGVFDISDEGLRLKAMDPSQISMISFFMPKKIFAEYAVGERVRLGVDIGKLSKVLARGVSGESVELGTEDGKLHITFRGAKKKRVFRIPLLDLGEGLEKEPKIEYKNKAVISSDALREVLKDAKLLSTHITFVVDDKKLKIEIKGDEGEIAEEFEKDGVQLKEASVAAPAKATYPLGYLEDMIKATKSETDIALYIETDRPLKIEYVVAGAEAKYYLAPRIESA